MNIERSLERKERIFYSSLVNIQVWWSSLSHTVLDIQVVNKTFEIAASAYECVQ